MIAATANASKLFSLYRCGPTAPSRSRLGTSPSEPRPLGSGPRFACVNASRIADKPNQPSTLIGDFTLNGNVSGPTSVRQAITKPQSNNVAASTHCAIRLASAISYDLRLKDQHAIAIRVEPIACLHGMPVRGQNELSSSKCADQHQQAGFRQVKVGKHRVRSLK